MTTDKLTIKETTIDDIDNVVLLWNDGEVMFYVGFPNGLEVTRESILERWLPNVNVSPARKHYSIYCDGVGYCGESYYGIDQNNQAALDIKLFPKARGKGIAYAGLKHAIDEAFTIGNADSVYVDPSKKNEKALKLYEKFGFKELPHPEEKYRDSHHYFVLRKEDYNL